MYLGFPLTTAPNFCWNPRLSNVHLKHVILLEFLSFATPGLPHKLLHWDPNRCMPLLISILNVGTAWSILSSQPTNICNSGWATDHRGHILVARSGICCCLAPQSFTVKHPALSCTMYSGATVSCVTLIINKLFDYVGIYIRRIFVLLHQWKCGLTLFVCLYFSYAGFSSGEQERFLSKMPPRTCLYYFNFNKKPKSIAIKLHADISTSSDKEGTRIQVLKFQSNPHLPLWGHD